MLFRNFETYEFTSIAYSAKLMTPQNKEDMKAFGKKFILLEEGR